MSDGETALTRGMETVLLRRGPAASRADADGPPAAVAAAPLAAEADPAAAGAVDLLLFDAGALAARNT